MSYEDSVVLNVYIHVHLADICFPLGLGSSRLRRLARPLQFQWGGGVALRGRGVRAGEQMITRGIPGLVEISWCLHTTLVLIFSVIRSRPPLTSLLTGTII
jgi:hypothetical protein